MIGRFWRMLFHIKRRDRLPRLPRRLANDFTTRDIESGMPRIFARTAARDPAGVQQLVKRHKVESIQQLIPLVPFQDYRPNWRMRLLRFFQRVEGSSGYEPTVRPALTKMRQAKQLPLDRPTHFYPDPRHIFLPWRDAPKGDD